MNVQEPDNGAEVDIAAIPPWNVLYSDIPSENKLMKKLVVVALQSYWLRLYKRNKTKR